jgi:hypothetical protein
MIKFVTEIFEISFFLNILSRQPHFETVRLSLTVVFQYFVSTWLVDLYVLREFTVQNKVIS